MPEHEQPFEGLPEELPPEESGEETPVDEPSVVEEELTEEQRLEKDRSTLEGLLHKLEEEREARPEAEKEAERLADEAWREENAEIMEVAAKEFDASLTLAEFDRTIVDRVRESFEEELDVDEDAAPEEILFARQDRTEKHIRETKETIRSTVAAETFPDDEGNRQATLNDDLKTFSLPGEEPGGVEVFLERYAEIMKQPDGNERRFDLIALRDRLRVTLNENHDGQLYTPEEVNRIFAALTTTAQIENYVYIVFENRLLASLAIDLAIGTNIYGAIERVILRDDITATEKLEIIDRLMTEISEEQWAAANMQRQIVRLRDTTQNFANVQFQAQEIVEQEAVEQALEEETEEKTLTEALQELGASFAQFADENEDVQAVMTGHHNIGNTALVAGVLASGTVEKVEDGYSGTIEGETVHLVERNGKPQAFLKEGNREIPIERTDPPAIGFNLARSKKIAIKNGWEGVADREPLRWMLMDNPGRSEFMTASEAKNFEGLLMRLLVDKGSNRDGRLLELHILDNQGSLDERYVAEYKKYITLKADGNMAGLKLEKDELTNLGNKWFAEGDPDANDIFIA